MPASIMTAAGPGKVCSKCGVFKLREGGYSTLGKRGGWHAWCKECKNAYAKARLAAHPDIRQRARAATRDWKRRNRERYNAYCRQYIKSGAQRDREEPAG